jgi:hypothetical protein
MRDKQVDPLHRIRAAEMILDRAWGKPRLGSSEIPDNYPGDNANADADERTKAFIKRILES